MSTTEKLRESQRLLADTQRAILVKPWWSDGKEVLKVTAAAVALLAALWAGVLEVRKGVLTAEVSEKRAQIASQELKLAAIKQRMNFYYEAVLWLKEIPEELIGVIEEKSNQTSLAKWEKEALSDAYILSAAYNAVCGLYKASDSNVEMAKSFDTNATDFDSIEDALSKLKLLPLSEGSGVSC